MPTSEIKYTREMVVRDGKKTMSALTKELGCGPTDKTCVIQYGSQAERPGEPAELTGEFIEFHPESRIGGFFAKVTYADDTPDYVDMHLPRYARGKKPPRFISHDVYNEAKSPDGAKARRYSHTERPIDREHYISFVKLAKCRLAYKVKEGEENE